MTDNIYNCRLFNGLDPIDVSAELRRTAHTVRLYSRGDVVALEGSRIGHLLILTDGLLSVEKSGGESGNAVVEKIASPALIAPAFLFCGNGALPATFIADTPVRVVSVSREELVEMMGRNRRVMINFLEIVSGPDKILSDKVTFQAYRTIKGRLARFLLDRSAEAGATSFRNNMTQNEMADLFRVTRPALARALGELCAEGTIYVKNKDVTILFAEKLKQYTKIK